MGGFGGLFWLRRLHSLFGLLPLGTFLIFHFWENSFAELGPGPYNRVVGGLRHLPYLVWIEVLVLAVPILLHLVLGLLIISRARLNLGRYPYSRNWNFYLQRLSGVLIVGFLLYHVGSLRLGLFAGGPVSFAGVASRLRVGWVFALYVAGVTATVFHLANGLWNFLVHFGVTVGSRAQRWSGYLSWAFFAVLLGMGFSILAAFRPGGLL